MADFDLAAWDFKEEFSGHEVAALILGLEPTEVSKVSVEPVAARLERDFYRAVSKLHRAYAGRANWAGLCRRDPDDPIPLDMIPEIEAELATRARLVAEWEAAEAGTDKQETEILVNSTKMKEWEKDAFVSGGIELFDNSTGQPAPGVLFEDQKFEREEIVRWLQAIGMGSKYRFDLKDGKSSSELTAVAIPQSLESPIKNRERTTLLNIIGVLLAVVQNPNKQCRDSDAAVIREMVDNYSDKSGISERTLQEKFALAKRSLQEEK